MAVGWRKTCGFHRTCTPGTLAVRGRRLVVHSLLSCHEGDPGWLVGGRDYVVIEPTTDGTAATIINVGPLR